MRSIEASLGASRSAAIPSSIAPGASRTTKYLYQLLAERASALPGATPLSLSTAYFAFVATSGEGVPLK
jgi:hypothetical protein